MYIYPLSTTSVGILLVILGNSSKSGPISDNSQDHPRRKYRNVLVRVRLWNFGRSGSFFSDLMRELVVFLCY